MKRRCVSLVFALALMTMLPSIGQANSGDFNGGVAIGSSYAGVDTAPTNGLIVQGNVGIGTTSSSTALTVNGTANIGALQLNSVQVPLNPGGRLTLSSNTPVMTTDVTAATTIYYADYVNDTVPIYNGTNWIEYSLGGQISLALDSNSAHSGYQQSAKLFDLVIRNSSGSPQLCTGPAWSSNTARADSIAMQNGIWTNSGSWTVKCDTTSSTYTCSSNECTYVGTMYATANGQTQMNLIPTPVNGGTNNIVGLYNAYNHTRFISTESDSTSTAYSYTTAAWRACNNSTSNRVTLVDGLGQDTIFALENDAVYVGTNPASMQVALDATTPAGTGVQPQFTFSAPSGTMLATGMTQAVLNPVLGLHYLQCIEFGGTGVSFFPEYRYALSLVMAN
jgi:hypothetical protein